jgi:hypothetical protein
MTALRHLTYPIQSALSKIAYYGQFREAAQAAKAAVAVRDLRDACAALVVAIDNAPTAVAEPDWVARI